MNHKTQKITGVAIFCNPSKNLTRLEVNPLGTVGTLSFRANSLGKTLVENRLVFAKEDTPDIVKPQIKKRKKSYTKEICLTWLAVGRFFGSQFNISVIS